MNEVLINGQWSAPGLARDRGLYYGDGLFETMRLSGEGVALWDLHLQRLYEGCDRLHIPRPDRHILEHECNMMIRAEAGPAVIKLIYTRGEGARGYRLPEHAQPRRLWYRMPLPALPERHWREGVAVRMCELCLAEQPALAGLKTLNRLEQVLARAEWHDEDIQEGIMCSTRGDVIEGTMSNVFVVKDGALFTPRLDRCGVAGVMRRKILELAEADNIPCHIVELRPEELRQADELFLSNSLIGIWPVRRLMERALQTGPLTRRLQSLIAAIVPCDEVPAS